MYSIQETRHENLLKQFDFSLFIAVLVLSIIGLFVVNSATLTLADGGSRILMVQVIALVAGIFLAVFIGSLDYKDFKMIGVFIYIFSILLLILVLIIGTGDQLGSRSWIKVGTVSFQPSEISKIAFILVSSVFLERICSGHKAKRENVIKLILYALIPIGLVLAQHDFGTAMVFMFMFLCLLFVSGVRYRYIIMMISTFILTTPFIWFFVLNDKRRDRIRVFLNPELDPLGSGFNVLRSIMAIGSGQFYGKGLYHGIQTQNSAVPVKESDFIFSVIGEELGFAGALVVVGLIFFILLRCVYIAKNSRDSYGSFLVVGVCSMFGAHFIENIGMTIGLSPVTGIPLSFVSAGGSALITGYIALGIVLSVSTRRKRNIFG